MDNQKTLYHRFIRLVLTSIAASFVVAIILFESINYSSSLIDLDRKLNKVSTTFSLLYAESVADGDIANIKNFTLALMADEDIALIVIRDTQANVLDSYTANAPSYSLLKRTTSIDFANEERFEQVGELDIALSTAKINATLLFRIKCDLALLASLIISVLLVIKFAFKQAIAKSLKHIIYSASHDDLTDLLNRKAFDEAVQINHEMLKSKPCQLLFLDLNDFKIINDSYGHQVGDRTLKDVAQLFKSSIRAHDIIARVGGDEFAILLINCLTTNASLIATTICQQLDQYLVDGHIDNKKLGVSIGMTRLTASSTDAINLDDAFLRADKACYVAKKFDQNHAQWFEELS